MHSINIALLPGFIFSLHPNNFVKPLFPFTNGERKRFLYFERNTNRCLNFPNDRELKLMVVKKGKSNVIDNKCNYMVKVRPPSTVSVEPEI